MKLKSFRILGIFILLIAWFLSGWPPIWQNPRIPPKIKEAQAATSTYDFSICGADCDTSANWWASGDDVDVFPFAGLTGNRNTHLEATDAQYTALSSSNNSRYATADPGSGDEIFLWNEMKINEEATSITQIDLTFEGYLALTANFSIWVKKTGQAYEVDASWVQIGTSQSITGGSETSFTRSVTANFSDYIGADGIFTWGVYEDVSSEAMNIDYVKAVVTYTPPVVTVGTTGSQTANMYANSTNNYTGGTFTFIRNNGSSDVTQIIITEQGTVNANANLSNVDIYYETADTCTYDANETLFGNTTSFNASEKTTVAGTISVGTSQVCVYVVLDVGSGASADQTIEIEISNPSTEVTVSAGTVSPATTVAIAGTTTLQAAVVSVSVSDGGVSYGMMPANTSKSTLTGELNDMQTATNDGNVTENFNIKGQDATGGGCTWTLAAANGSDQYVHEFCNDTDLDCTSPPTNYTALTTTYQTLKTGVAVSGTVQTQLRLTTPNPSSCFGQQSADITIQAVQP